jgi:hypothetical protein
MKPIPFTTICLFIVPILVKAQLSDTALAKKLPIIKTVDVPVENNTDPVFFIDSIQVNKRLLQNYNPNDIASVTVYKNANATTRVKSATNGLVYIETKNFARLRYWKYFKSKSGNYAKIVTSPESDSTIQYILNNKILKENFEADLAAIDNKTYRGIKIISKQQLVHDYNIMDKDYGVLISSKVLSSYQYDLKIDIK